MRCPEVGYPPASGHSLFVRFTDRNGDIDVEIGASVLPIGGTNTSASVVVTSPSITSGTAFTPSATQDSMVYVQITGGASGTVTFTMGPSTGAENTIANAMAVPSGSGEELAVRVPAGWKAVVTVSVATIAQTRVVTC